MIELAGQVQAQQVGRVLLAADVGGTHARIGLVSTHPDRRRPVTVLRYARYACADWPSLTAVLRHFVDGLGGEHRIEEGALAIAGYLLDDAIINETLPWRVSIGEIRASLGIGRLDVVNDFEAVAWASQFLAPGETRAVIEGGAAQPGGSVLVVGPGTGLGSAVLLPGRPHVQVIATEAGQIALAPGNEREIAVLRALLSARAHVCFEHVLSGPGLLNLYRVLCALDGHEPMFATPEGVTGAALAYGDKVAIEALDIFCAWLGSFVGDLVLLYGASGGVYLAGGILPQIHDALLTSAFAERFLNKGVMRPFLEQVPVRLMDHGQLGVIGAAGMFLDAQSKDGRRDG